MRNLSRILTVILCCAPVMSIAAGPVATTNGSNLTSYNPNNAYNNQWATISNGRYDADTTAKADFGNCNAVVLRCAQPKCSGGGCTDASVAGAIVSGCVKSNSKCKQYGDDLIEYMTAQLVANSNAKIQEQQVALEQAKIQADAQAAAAAAANSQNEQMMAQMQNQMYQMQQQMAQQQEESNRQLQEALAQQQAQSAAALESMKTAATESAQQTESGITSYQQEAINRGISTDVLERQKITGQIMTEIENADLKLKAVKTAMQNSFDYAKCDNRGNNCSAPTRIKKWRELARGFSDPYVDTLQKIYNALLTAQSVGVDLSQIYMMLDNSCNQWGQYLCPAGIIEYPESDNTKEGPKVCNRLPDNACLQDCLSKYDTDRMAGLAVGQSAEQRERAANTKLKVCRAQCEKKRNCQKCRLLKMLTDQEEVYAGWLDTDPKVTDEQRTVVSCASGVLQGSTIFSTLLKKRDDSTLVNMEVLEKWLDQVEPGTAIGNVDCNTCGENNTKCGMCYCVMDSGKRSVLERASAKKSVFNLGGDDKLCVKDLWGENRGISEADISECTYINPIFAICDTHPYNAGKEAENYTKDGATIDASDQEQMNEIIGLKITVISQQMYKQYEYLRATLQRLKIQLEKSVLAANLEAAGGKSDSSSSSGLLGGGRDSDKTIYLAGAENCANKMSSESVYSCIQGNVSLIISSASSNANKACKQLKETIDAAETWKIKVDEEEVCKNIKAGTCEKKNIIPCAQKLNVKVAQEKEKKAEKTQYRGWGNYSR